MRSPTRPKLGISGFKEVYRPITVRDGGEVLSMPALQAVIRALIAAAAKGNGTAQRMRVWVVKQVEQQLAAARAADGPSGAHEDWLASLG